MACEEVVVGLMSGTSMDGIDVCVVKIVENQTNHTCHLKHSVLYHATYEYPMGLKEDLLTIIDSGGIGRLAQFNVLIGKLFGESVLRALKGCGISPQQIKLVGSHGQTVFHQPNPELLHGHTVTSSLQIGDPSTIAITCGITTVGDFRLADMACGGQGAPLVPYLDHLLARRHFDNTGRVAVFLNIGGISNIFTVNHKTGSSIGFDTGPGNVLIDGLMKILYDKSYDDQGCIGTSGSINRSLLQSMIDRDIFITRKPPKSTGREYYSADYISDILKTARALNIKDEDIISTVTAFTAHAVVCNYTDHMICHMTSDYNDEDIDLLVSGGGAMNNYLMRCLQEEFKTIKVNCTDTIGVPIDCKEALCFAILGYETLKNRPTNIPSVTGASQQNILGKICPVLRPCNYTTI